MLAKREEKERAIKLRKQGLSYDEIRKQVPVSHASLSFWLRNVKLSQAQKTHLQHIQKVGQAKGALRQKQNRIDLENKIKVEAAKEVGILSAQSLLLMGAALYWAEGNKQKPHSVSTGIKFSNSDPEMIKFFRKWLMEICKVAESDIVYELYIHKTGDVIRAKKFWEKVLKFSSHNFLKVRLKNFNSRSYRKNRGEDYHGLIRLDVKKSTNLNRRVMGLAEGACKQFINNSGVV